MTSAAILGLAMTAVLQPAQPFVFHNGDRVVLVGDTLIEREGRFGWLETLLTLANSGKKLTFRNLGWSGDTVAGVSRSGFDPPEAGFQQLVDQVLATRPTVLILGFGMADSFEGERGLARFVQDYQRLLDALAGTHARLIFLTPIRHEDHGPPLPDPQAHNRSLKSYASAIEGLAHRRGAFSINLLGLTRGTNPALFLTDDGIHLTERGSQALAVHVTQALLGQLPIAAASIRRDASGSWHAPQELAIEQVHSTAERIELAIGTSRLAPQRLTIAIEGLARGRYRLLVDSRPGPLGSELDWARGVTLEPGPGWEQVQKLRATVNRKNQLFFHRWRPQNITYLFGFRKHEQGNNAVEVPRFDPLVEQAEAAIEELTRPLPRTLVIERVTGRNAE